MRAAKRSAKGKKKKKNQRKKASKGRPGSSRAASPRTRGLPGLARERPRADWPRRGSPEILRLTLASPETCVPRRQRRLLPHIPRQLGDGDGCHGEGPRVTAVAGNAGTGANGNTGPTRTEPHLSPRPAEPSTKPLGASQRARDVQVWGACAEPTGSETTDWNATKQTRIQSWWDTYILGHGLVDGPPPDLVLGLGLLDDPLVQGRPTRFRARVGGQGA